MKILTWDPKKKKTVLSGYFEDGVFHRHVEARHFMRKFQAYAIQEDVIQKLMELKCRLIILHTHADKLESLFDNWLAPDIRVMDFGWGKQRFMPVKRMKRTQPPPLVKAIQHYMGGR